MKRFILVLACVAAIVSLTACGTDETALPAGSSNWDQMVWDQDNWA